MIPNNALPRSRHDAAASPEQQRPRRSRAERDKRRREKQSKKNSSNVNTLVFNPFFVLGVGLLFVSLTTSFVLVLNHPENFGEAAVATSESDNGESVASKKLIDHDAQGKAGAKATAAADDDDDAAAAAADAGGLDADDDGVAAKQEKERLERKKKEHPHDKAGQGDDYTDDFTDDHAIRFAHFEKVEKKHPTERFAAFDPETTPVYENVRAFDTSLETPHKLPRPPLLPPFAPVDKAEQLIDDLLHHNKPTIAGIIAFLNDYHTELHAVNKKTSEENSFASQYKNGKDSLDPMSFVRPMYALIKKFLDPFEEAYRGRTIFPIRDDDSLYVSLAAFREHLLGSSLRSAFDKAKNPDKLYVGCIVQNCFGMNGTVCRTGMKVVGNGSNGRPRTSIMPAPPDANGVEDFCTDPKYKKYCDSGQIRVLYVHDTDALGPLPARYYASKLWGGETYYMQMDAHLEFAPNWDEYYIDEMKATQSFPSSVLSAYPPGFENYDHGFEGTDRGARLCASHFAKFESHILRIEMYHNYPLDAPVPTQIPFIAAGFFFTHASFLRDVPFDPYAPWCFMGEEIALSLRAWTSGFNIYAPRRNMIAHQYRPGKLGLPKFWESVGRDSGRPGINGRLQEHVIRRFKHLMAYPDASLEQIKAEGDEIVLSNHQHYSLGRNRTLEAYLRWTKINPTKLTNGKMEWCINSELP